MELTEVIRNINKSCAIYFPESSFHLRPSKTNQFVISGNNVSKALNNFKNGSEQITAIKWFDDFWIYIILKVISEKTFISISVFQGAEEDDFKSQLFRAEWDDYQNPNEKHPQPHWHLMANSVIHKSLSEIAHLDDSDILESIINEEKSNIVEISKMHLPLNGNWFNGGSHINTITEKKKLVVWFKGILSCMKEQLEYAR